MTEKKKKRILQNAALAFLHAVSNDNVALAIVYFIHLIFMPEKASWYLLWAMIG